jgi:hypothetical protein
MEATLTHQVMDERRKRALARLAWEGAGQRAWAHDIRVNGPSKSAPLPCGGAASFCRLNFWLVDC